VAEAELGRLAGDVDPSGWLAAAERWDAVAEPHPAAYARFRASEAMLVAGGDRHAAGDLLGAAHAVAAALGAGPLRHDVEALAARARLTLTPAEPRGGEDGLLTAREADVLQLLADGLTNREIAGRLFISQKTVGTHVGHIFDKLGVHNRVEAAGRARRLGLAGHDP